MSHMTSAAVQKNFDRWWKKYVGVRLPDQLGGRHDIATDAYFAGFRAGELAKKKASKK